MVVHRSDGSGTTYIWSDYLSKVSDEWKGKVGKGTSINWPVGLGGKGNEGVSGLIKQTPDAIGYIELIYAIQNKMPYGLVKNTTGAFIKASLDGVSAAAAGAATNMPDDFRVSITDAPGKGAYPISSFTWLLIPAQIQDAGKREAIKGFLNWMLTDGQQYCEGLGLRQTAQRSRCEGEESNRDDSVAPAPTAHGYGTHNGRVRGPQPARGLFFAA